MATCLPLYNIEHLELEKECFCQVFFFKSTDSIESVHHGINYVGSEKW